MRSGPINQFCTSERVSTLPSRNTSPSSSYLTFASGGYIIKINPTAIGTDVVPTLSRFKVAGTPGTKTPRITPTKMARKIQSVRNRSRNESFSSGVLETPISRPFLATRCRGRLRRTGIVADATLLFRETIGVLCRQRKIEMISRGFETGDREL